MSQRTIENGTG